MAIGTSPKLGSDGDAPTWDSLRNPGRCCREPSVYKTLLAWLTAFGGMLAGGKLRYKPAIGGVNVFDMGPLGRGMLPPEFAYECTDHACQRGERYSENLDLRLSYFHGMNSFLKLVELFLDPGQPLVYFSKYLLAPTYRF